ncbi:MAG: hypothetical protein IRZ31_07880 [Thermogemmatispora sp.]|uniref:hypothetical protein n=1 Tax=Thermogemmatispora sp. TaxID=1968838 RepID=UPI0026291178|nr:hypothetical protein [Thermogemmatispora sp.]MBX5456804.1 hypothetical protein [Thermogemmatispora sp.]
MSASEEQPSRDGSEVARLLAQIQAEYEAAERGLQGLALGVSRHCFITRRMERMGEIHAQLRALVGEEAMILIARHLDGPQQR